MNANETGIMAVANTLIGELQSRSLGVELFVLILCSYLIWAIPFCLLDYFQLFQDSKIQNKPITKYEVEMCFKLVGTNFLVLLPATILSDGFLRSFINLQKPELPSNPLVTCLTLFAFYLVHDLFFYTYHRVLHSYPMLYKNIHKVKVIFFFFFFLKKPLN